MIALFLPFNDISMENNNFCIVTKTYGRSLLFLKQIVDAGCTWKTSNKLKDPLRYV